MDLKGLRTEIDQIDEQLSRLYLRRMQIADAVAQHKIKNQLPVLDASREAAVIDRVRGFADAPDMKQRLAKLFEYLMADSRAAQQAHFASCSFPPVMPEQKGVAFLGIPGSFSEEAAVACFGEHTPKIPSASFDEIVQGVECGRLPCGILPVENSLTGGIYEVMDQLPLHRVHIVAETIVPVRHCLLARPDTKLSDITTVLSHAQPLDQCRQSIKRLGLFTQTRSSTAEAAKEVADGHEKHVAAIASLRAGQLYGLSTLLGDMQDNAANYTRFVVIVPGEVQPDPQANKVSAVFVLEHRPGTLFGLLSAFASRKINLLNLVSRPVPGSPWQYSFQLDFEGNLAQDAVMDLLAEVRNGLCQSIILLGNYRKWEQKS